MENNEHLPIIMIFSIWIIFMIIIWIIFMIIIWIIFFIRKVMLDGVGEEESLVVTGGAADHLAVVYKTDDQVMMVMVMVMVMVKEEVMCVKNAAPEFVLCWRE